MNKNIKRTIAIALALGIFSAVAQTNFGIYITEAYASTSDVSKLTDLELTTSSGMSLDIFEDSDYNDKLSDNLEMGEKYYTKTSSNKVVINDIDGADEDNVRIFKENSDNAYKVGEDISILSGTAITLKIRVYNEDYDEDKTYSSSDYIQYIIEVENTDKKDDNINLSNLKLSSGYINFNNNDTYYELNVASGVSSIIVQAIPEKDNYTVTIDGTTVDEDDKYEKTVFLSTDSTIIKIKVLDDNDNAKTYTLTVVKIDTTQKSGNDKKNNNGLHKGWINKNSSGNQGLHKGWRNNNGEWYYLDNNGKMKTGWFNDTDNNGEWYYFDNNGKMRTGWFKDADENWYYLQSSGAMAKNTKIEGYKLGANGAWVK